MRKTMKILISALLVLCMVMPMATMVFAAGNADTASVYTGEKNNPDDWSKQDWIDNFANYETELTIDSAYELVTFAQASASLAFTDDTVVTVTTDIVLNEGDPTAWMLDATGLFAFPGITNFVGTFDGNGKSVSGVYMKHSGTSNNTYDGFFKVLASGTTTIKDYAIVNSYFTNDLSAYAATFICRINSTANVTVSGLYSNAIVKTNYSGNAGSGGIVSLVSATPNYPTIKGCVFDGIVIASSGPVGGIVGLNANYSEDANHFAVTVQDCANFGLLEGGDRGGIIGDGNHITINRCVDYADYSLVGRVYRTIDGGENYIFNGKSLYSRAEDSELEYMGTDGVISEDNKGDGAYDLDYLDFGETWTVRANDYPVPKAVYENFGKYFGSFKTPAYDDPNATVSVYKGFKNYADDWTPADWKANYEAGGEYTIDSAYELVSFAKAGLSFKADATVKLTKDIVINEGNAESWSETPAAIGWTPIDNFQGTFDGQGHTVSGVYYNQTADMMGAFFGRVTNATVKNFGLVNSLAINRTSNGSWYLGGMIGRVNYSNLTLTDCYTDAIVCGTGYSGGFIGLSSNRASTDHKLTIERCVFAGKCLTGNNAGGFIGLGQASGASNVEIKDSVNMGYVSIAGSNKGAFISSLDTLNMSNCISYNPVTTKMVNSATNKTVANNYVITDSYNQTVVGTSTDGGITVNRDAIIGTDASVKTTLSTLDFTNTWTLRENDYPLPADVYEMFADEIDSKDISGYVDFSEALVVADATDKVVEIGTADALKAMAISINNGAIATYALGYTFVLTSDIVLNEGDAKDWATEAPATMWESIKNFRGTFDGQGHTISGIYFKTTTQQFHSFFGVLGQDATVKNFGVLNSYLYFGNNYGGGVIGRIDAKNVTVKGIYSEAIVESNVGNGTGGIIGLVSNTGTDAANVTYAVIEDCVFAGTVNAKGSGQAGGIVGQSANYQFCQAVIKNCANYGTVYGTTAGAIIGMTSNVILDKCLNAGTVICKNADDEMFFNSAMVAAFGGSLDMSCVVNNCYNVSGNVICRPDTYTKGTTEYVNPTVLTAEDKGSAIFSTGWSARDGYITEDNYPLPTSIFENFFAIDVKYVQSTAVKNGTYSVRFTAEIDSLDFSKAGFKVTATIGGVTKTIDIPVATAYKTVMAGEGEGYAAVTARDGRYYVSITLTDMPAADATYVVTPYTVGDVGEEVEGITKTLNFNANGVLVSAN